MINHKYIFFLRENLKKNNYEIIYLNSIKIK